MYSRERIVSLSVVLPMETLDEEFDKLVDQVAGAGAHGWSMETRPTQAVVLEARSRSEEDYHEVISLLFPKIRRKFSSNSLNGDVHPLSTSEVDNFNNTLLQGLSLK